MAQSSIEIELVWENGVEFKMTSQKDGGAVITILKVQENADFGSIHAHATDLCCSFFRARINEIMAEMLT